jgi:hypothetical protein
MYFPDYKSLESTYLVVEDFADWLTKTRQLSIHGGFKNDSRLSNDGMMRSERTWSLLRRMAANFEDLEKLDICRESWGLYLPPIFKWLACPKLKKLDIHGISEWKHGSIELEPEVRISLTINLLKRLRGR